MTRILILGICLGALAGCMDDLPTGPDARPIVPARSPAHGGPDARTAAMIGLDDALERLLPALTDPLAAVRLAAMLREARQGVEHPNGNGLPPLLEAARTAVDTYESVHPQDAADLDAIRLALAHADEGLGRPARRANRPARR